MTLMPTAPARSGSPLAPVVPARCTIVTGPSGTETARWIQETIHTSRVDRLSARCAVLVSLENAAEMARFAEAVPRVTVRRLTLPCLCCPGAAELPRRVRALAEESDADWLFVALPVLAANGLIAEFDALVRWPREVVVCLDDAWTEARRTDSLSYFQFRLISAADRVIAAPARSGHAGRRLEVSRSLVST